MSFVLASGPVIWENEKILLVKDYKDDFWKFCGGRPLAEESDLKRTAREAFEELGIEIELDNQGPFILFTEKEVAGQTTSIVLVHWLAFKLSEIKPGPETAEWRWFSEKELLTEKLGPNIIPTLKHFNLIKTSD